MPAWPSRRARTETGPFRSATHYAWRPSCSRARLLVGTAIDARLGVLVDQGHAQVHQQDGEGHAVRKAAPGTDGHGEKPGARPKTSLPRGVVAPDTGSVAMKKAPSMTDGANR